jgi:hypothetical protein
LEPQDSIPDPEELDSPREETKLAPKPAELEDEEEYLPKSEDLPSIGSLEEQDNSDQSSEGD